MRAFHTYRPSSSQANPEGRRLAWLLAGWVVICAGEVLATTPSDAPKTNAPGTATNATSVAQTNAPAPLRAPESPREFFNAGTRQLADGKLREAEAFFETALASQNVRLQPPALYNLGHVRFSQGVAELKKGPKSGPTSTQARTATAAGASSVQDAADALASNDVQRMVSSYVRGRGTRRELNAAIKAVKRAIEVHGITLAKWQRSSSDFKSATEMNKADADAAHNAQVVDRSIARLIDSLQELQQAANMLGQKKQELGDKMKELKGRIPEPDMPPGAPGDEEEEEDQPKGPEPDQQEGETREGKEMPLTPEQAEWLLQSFKLDANRRLPMGFEATEPSKPRERLPW
jgi:tetratricopeptide (TPR) repeat protein